MSLSWFLVLVPCMAAGFGVGAGCSSGGETTTAASSTGGSSSGGGGAGSASTGSGAGGSSSSDAGPQGSMFACGSEECDGTTQVCVHHLIEANPGEWYECDPFPSTCTMMHTCYCLDHYSSLSDGLDCQCSEDAQGNFFTCHREP